MSIAATVGKPIILKIKACIHDGFIMFSRLSKSVDTEFLYYLLTLMENNLSSSIGVEFLYYFLSQMESKFDSLGQQGTQSNINTELVSSMQFAKPPLLE
jgi:type I restriction enzyme, S subunit